MSISLPKLRRWLPVLILVLMGLFLGRAWLLGKSVATVPAEYRDLTETVISSGRVVTPDRVVVGAELLGRVLRVAVEEGDRVTAGQVLATLDDAEQRAGLEQSRRAVDEAEARLAQLDQVAAPVAEQALAQAAANLAQAGAEFERVQALAAAGFYNQSRLDEARRALDGARAGHAAAQAQARGSRPDGVEVRLARARLAQARAALALASAKRDKMVLRAPVAGLLVVKAVEAGDTVSQGKTLFQIAADGDSEIVLQVDEKNLGRLALGQAAGVLADAYPGQPFQATLFHIAPAVDAAKGSVEAKLKVAAPPAFLRADMTVSVEITVGRRPRALTLPVAAVREAASTRPWALVVEDGRAQRRDLQLGLRGTGAVEVRAGLAAGARVILPEANVRPGDRVNDQARS